MDKDDLAQALQCVQSEIEFELILEKLGLQLGENLSRLFSLREKIRKLIVEAVKEVK